MFDSVGFALEDFSALRYLERHLLGDVHTRTLDLLESLFGKSTLVRPAGYRH